MAHRNRLLLAVAAACFLTIVVIERFAPANVVAAYGYVLPILLVAIVRKRRLMVVTVVACVVATYAGPATDQTGAVPGGGHQSQCGRRCPAARGLSRHEWEERKAREEAARAALARETENLLKANAQLVEIKDQLNRSERLAAVGQLVASVAHEVGTPLHSIAWHVQALGEEPCVTTEMKRRISIIDGQLDRVVRIIQDLPLRPVSGSRTRPGHRLNESSVLPRRC